MFMTSTPKNHKTLLRENKADKKRYIMLIDWKTQYNKVIDSPQINPCIQWTQNHSSFFGLILQTKIYTGMQRAKISQGDIKEK